MLNREMILNLESIEDFRKWINDDGRSVMTSKAYCSDLKTMLARMDKDQVAREDFEQIAKDYLNSTRDHSSPNTTNRRMASMRTFAKFAWEMSCLTSYKTPVAADPEPHPLPGGMADIEKLFEVAVNDNQRALVVLQGYFALRVSEAINVSHTHFDEHQMKLTVRGKGDKMRRLPFSAETLAKIIDQYQRSLLDSHPVVLLSNSGARNAITTLGSKAGIARPISSHDLRATCLTELYEITKDIELVRRFAGHASVKQTQVYIKASESALINAVKW